MNAFAERFGAIVFSAFIAFALAGCSNAEAGSDDPPEAEEAESAAASETAREDIEAAISEAAGAEYDNVTFVQNTETSATSMSQGQTQQQTTTSTMKGELSVAEDNRAMHIAYSQSSNMELGKTTYDMYIDPTQLIVEQSGQYYVDQLDEGGFDNYAASITALASEDEISSMLDVAKDYKMEERNGDTVISITVDVDKLVEEEMVDTSSLPEGNSIATMVMNYTIDEDHRFKTIRLMSSTSGSPTYHVTQTYRFSKYNETTLPEWPDLNAYMRDQMGIQTDANGNMFIVTDDGTTQYIESIGEDGTIYLQNPTIPTAATGGGDTVYYYDDGTTTTAPSTSGTTDTSDADSSSGDDSSDDRGRAYITADDGTIHFLDEEGGRVIENSDGTRYFIDADGNLYFLSE